ncbi:hypothetical protein P7K49_037439 [Saguinus oedipus]|uniref:Uncharacterized protein n=1 Tax=Saguinus oedipus TaxID=9490 RepID=A0ABQ9TI33_SAGOE|nr:hypothetical protein P7K49_037439 [Saguinus oedipus]
MRKASSTQEEEPSPLTYGGLDRTAVGSGPALKKCLITLILFFNPGRQTEKRAIPQDISPNPTSEGMRGHGKL